MKKKVLITGGSGFIGSSVKKCLSSLGFEILTIGRSKKEDFQFDLVKGLSRDKLLEKTIKDFSPDIVCHFASGSNIVNANRNKEEEFNYTVLSTKYLIKVLEGFKLDKFIYLSSQAVYGLPKTLPVSELHPTNPATIYGENKLKVENIITQSKLNYLIFRISSVYGALQNPERSGAIANFISKIKNNQSPVVFNSFDLYSDFIYIDDVTSAIVNAIQDGSHRPEIYNLGSGTATTLKEILNILYRYFPNAPKPKLMINALYPNKEQKGLYLDISKIQRELKWNTKYNIEEGLDLILKSVPTKTI